MREISGFGGSYEHACRAMLRAGGEYADQHPSICYAITTSRRGPGGPPAAMDKAMCDAADNDVTGAMFSATLSHIVFVLHHSWEEFVERMREELAAELNGGTELRR